MKREVHKSRLKVCMESIEGIGNHIENELIKSKHSDIYIDRIFEKIIMLMRLSYEVGRIIEYYRLKGVKK